ncbi:hypothetical protein HELRODRAFT_172697 [Helobdella robusta]|uniref:Uncharacterized protein n=1 Tax=Helobdella robusta TaxID=6412 RepID=T1F5T2_HELRO|nr:hypothetical protein HELRODRAFT_172697 [Helobdella robusta]ESO04335.1 hypothetical protein HELRODRAFT_172697 [Helobdella robusta]
MSHLILSLIFLACCLVVFVLFLVACLHSKKCKNITEDVENGEEEADNTNATQAAVQDSPPTEVIRNRIIVDNTLCHSSHNDDQQTPTKFASFVGRKKYKICKMDSHEKNENAANINNINNHCSNDNRISNVDDESDVNHLDTIAPFTTVELDLFLKY